MNWLKHLDHFDRTQSMTGPQTPYSLLKWLQPLIKPTCADAGACAVLHDQSDKLSWSRGASSGGGGRSPDQPGAARRRPDRMPAVPHGWQHAEVQSRRLE